MSGGFLPFTMAANSICIISHIARKSSMAKGRKPKTGEELSNPSVRRQAAIKGWETRRRNQRMEKREANRLAKMRKMQATRSALRAAGVKVEATKPMPGVKMTQKALEAERKKFYELGRTHQVKEIRDNFMTLMNLTGRDAFWDKRNGEMAARSSFVRVLVELDAGIKEELDGAYQRWIDADQDQEMLESMCEMYAEMYDLPESEFYTFFIS